MEILLSHHFWKDNYNATWNPPLFPYPQIEQAVKESYAFLEQEKPPWRKYGNITAFTYYRTGKDAFGRDIVAISFAFVPNCIDPAACHRILAPLLARATQETTRLDVEFPAGIVAQPEAAQPKSGPRLKLALAAAAVALFGIAAFLLFGQNKRVAETHTSAPVQSEAPVAAQLPERIEKAAQPNEEVEKSVSESAVETQDAPQPTIKAPVAMLPELCANIEISQELQKCPRMYFVGVCERRIAETSYADWVKNAQGCQSRAGNYLKNNSPLNSDGRLVDQIKRFFEYGK